MQLDYTKILLSKYPQSEWSLNGNNYEGLTWLSDTKKPTKAQLDALWNEVLDEINAEAEALAQAKAAAEGKLAALGLTTDDLRALGL